MKIDFKKNWDVFAIIISNIILVILIGYTDGNILQIIIGLAFLFFIPGYALLLGIYPNHDDFKRSERIALSFGCSVAITPSIVLVLFVFHLELTTLSILFSVSAFNIVSTIIGLYSRRRLSQPYTPVDLIEASIKIRSLFRITRKEDRYSTFFLIISIISLIAVLMYVFLIPPLGETYSEFSIFGPNYSGSNYPSNITTNESNQVIIGITNHENRIINYTIEIWLLQSNANNISDIQKLYYFDNISITVPDSMNIINQNRDRPETSIYYNFTINITGQYKLWFILYKDTVPALPLDTFRYHEFSTTSAIQRIYDSIDNKYESLSLNISVS